MAPLYKISAQQVRTVDGVTFLLVETPEMGRRQHRRMIGSSAVQQELYGRPLLYSDVYPLANESTYVYCKHSCDPYMFFSALDTVLVDQLSSLAELRNRTFRVIVNRAGQFEERELALPFCSSLVADANVRFVRCYMPIGDVAISFGEPVISDRELDLVRENLLSSDLEFPLIGCDMTKSDIHIALMAKLHWAAGKLSQSTLENLIGQLSFNPVTA